MTHLERQIQQTIEKLAKLRIKKREEDARKKVSKPKKKPGRKPLDKELLQRIKLEAFSKPLPDVAFKYSVSLTSLYNHGITRKSLDAEVEKRIETEMESKIV